MSSWRFAFSRRWFGYLAAAVIFAIACAGLSKWQVDRTNETRAANNLVNTNYSSTPVDVESALPTLSAFRADQQWLRVRLTGKYLLDDQLLARNRPFNGQPGFEVLVPLLLDDGSVFIVDRGYVPTGNNQDTPDTIPEPASGTVSVVVRLLASEPTLDGQTAPRGQVSTIDLPTVAKLLDRPTYTGAYGLMATESPAAATRPSALPKPVLDEGLHISYAIQWIAFALMGFFGLGYAIRTEYRKRNEDDPEEREREAERQRRRSLKPRSDSEVEDDLLERAGR